MRTAAGAKGFTLIELLVVAAIIGVLASVALPLAEMSVQRGKEADLKRSLREVREAIDAYKRAFDQGWIEKKDGASGYPPSLRALVDGVRDVRDTSKDARIYFLRRLPVDPVSGEAWGLRSYASPADAPQAGSDVYDIYSQSDAVGLNGIPYKEW